MKLLYTPRSHFSRKVRILLDAWNVDVELVDVGNVAEASEANFGGNPLMKVPTLVDGERWLLDSDHIARYLTRTRAPSDPFSVLTNDIDMLNARVVMNGIMTAEVDLLLAQRTGIDTSAFVRFDKLKATITGGLGWLEQQPSTFPKTPSQAGFHLVCLWDHLALYKTVPLAYPALADIVAGLSTLPYVSASAPS